MFVQTARGASSAGGVLTLHAITPSTLFFSDRPQRIVGHLSSAQFVELWGEGENSFAEDPPNAVLSFLEPGDEAPEDAVIVDQGAPLGFGLAGLLVRCPGGSGPCDDRSGDPLHRPVRPTPLTGICGRHEPSRPAQGSVAACSRATPRRTRRRRSGSDVLRLRPAQDFDEAYADQKAKDHAAYVGGHQEGPRCSTDGDLTAVRVSRRDAQRTLIPFRRDGTHSNFLPPLDIDRAFRRRKG